MRRLRQTCCACGLIGLLCLLLAGCTTTNEDIDLWAQSVGGEERIAQALANPEIETGVRTYAMIKMIRLRDFDRLDKTLNALDVADRNLLIRSGAEEIGKLLVFPDLIVQAAAKDALYLFLKFDNDAVSRSARQALRVWYRTDFEKKFAAGTYSAFHILTALGPDAFDVVVEVMKTQPEVRSRVSKIAEALNDPTLNERIDALYLGWFNPGQDPEGSTEVLNLACFARGNAFTERLNGFVAERKNSYEMRRKAMNTLTYHPNPSSLPMVLSLIANPNETGDMRGMALEILEKTGTAEHAQALIPRMNDEHIRWFAFKAAVALGGPGLIGPMFKILKPGAQLWREDYDFAADVIAKAGAEAIDAVAPFLKSPDVNLAAIALLAIEKQKAAAHREGVAALSGDKRVVARYDAKNPATIGSLAQRVLKSLTPED